jgi:hypothetical protein
MATEKADNKAKNQVNTLKNEELLDPGKESVQNILDRGKRNVPKEGQSWSEINQNGRVDIKKPGLYHEAMKAKQQDNKGQEKQLDKDIDHDKDK